MTIYEKKLRLALMNPEVIKAYHLRSVAKGLSNYFEYISYSIFAGKNSKTKTKPLLRKYRDTYIEPTDGSTNGYPFYRSQAFGEINLKKVIAKQKVTEHKLKKRLEEINKILYKDTKKVEAKLADMIAKKQWVTRNMLPGSAQTLALYYEVREQIYKILNDRCFESKYKVDEESFKGYNIPTSAGDLLLILNRKQWLDLQFDFNLTDQGNASIGLDMFLGVKVLFSEDIDAGTAIIMHRDMFQFWILPTETRYNVIPYTNEETTDYVYETMHSLDVVPIYCSM